MRVILQEMKKIFHPVMLLLLVLINLLMYYIFIDFDISVFPNGRPSTDIYHIGIEMVEKYGHELDDEEFEDFKKVLQQEIKNADKYIQSDQEFAEQGITTYEQFQEMGTPGNVNPAIEKLHSRILEEGIDLFWEIPERESIIEEMEKVNERYGYADIYGTPTEKQENRIQAVVNSGAVNAIFPSYPVGYNLQTISASIAITILISVLFMISPLFIRDYKKNMVSLQYTSKTGRSLFKKKIAAGMLSAFFITTLLIIVYYSLYSTNNIGMFLSSSVNTFMGPLYWYDLSFLQLIIITIVLTYVLALSMALMAMFVSSICKNYISIIGIQLPLYVLVCWLIMSRALMSDALLISSSQWKLGILYCIIVIFPVSAIIWKVMKEKKKDILY